MSDTNQSLDLSTMMQLDDVKYMWRKFTTAVNGARGIKPARWVFQCLCLMVSALEEPGREAFMDWLESEGCSISIEMNTKDYRPLTDGELVQREITKVVDALGPLIDGDRGAVSPSNCSVKRAAGMLLVNVPEATEEAERLLRDAGFSLMRSVRGELYVFSSILAERSLAATK